ncbi:MAG TPA: ATP-dependent Clp protease ATP-binding subunit [Negativicutes bacterium]|uniref:Clp R domain-containing protein n=1 Tax=Candidatus Staskawiczbacteria bacterium RIFCSPHIGHO2_01_FULL_41_41 TaxID=1802203 RepID=A0A1G2HUX5_9BACT|nr:MAG: hypothetical protein A2822_02225 [Candidatus Staskawiczbacteria bacterium RIFCSPHIGHO2_01_FULL_41_41]OGZ74431.1 MAG: hypothetical protein A3A12_01525 [Candidatus Staskawiczbacteria bacterium RIFCSPLOWO2_01_FULL_43_17b]HLD70716.1 ATP-dependent Clp protease ATP-binding subunit [Negativicutes bacterium]
MFNFDTRTTQVSKSLKIWSFLPVKHASLFAQAFFYLFLISLVAGALSFIDPVFYFPAARLCVVFLLLFVFFLEVSLFTVFVVKKPGVPMALKEAMADPANHNLAEFLSLEACGIVERAVKICRSRRLLQVPSESLLYGALLINQDARALAARLGIDVKKTIQDLKNHLEKGKRESAFSLLFSPSFEQTILEAARLANQRGLDIISEKELLVALAKHDAFFKTVMIQLELKDKDVESVAFWLDAIEQALAKRAQFWLKENLARAGSLGRDWASGFTITLDRFSIDWTHAAKHNVFNEMVGHANEVGEVQTILAKSSAKNALLVGAEGSGRKSIVRAVAQVAYLGASLPEVNQKRFVELDLVSLLAKTQEAEKVELLLDQIFKEVITAGNVVLIIDNLENFAGDALAKPGTIDITGILAKYLAIPDFQFIGITSFEGLHHRLEDNPSFLEYFSKVEVSEVSEGDTLQILQNMAIGMEIKHRIAIPFPSVRETVNLTSRYLPSAPFPKKAIDIFQEALSYAKSLQAKTLLPSHIAKVISDKTQIPVGKMEGKEKSLLLNLDQLLHQKIVGQNEAVSEISIAMRRARSGISNKKRPMGTFLFLGPTGVGKTETAKALADIYFSGQEKMIRLDMSEFQSLDDIPRLLGASGANEQQGLLTTPVRENPFSLVLLDEIEKAHKDILNLFLQVFDDGYITDGQGRKVVFSNTIIICTSNAGAPDIFKSVEAGAMISKDALLASLFDRGVFQPEFINRFDAAIIFHPLSRENLMDIAQLMLASLAKNLQEKEIELVITEPLKQKIVELSYKPQFGAREMRRVMQDKVENAIADALLQDKITKGNKIEINPENFGVVVIK